MARGFLAGVIWGTVVSGVGVAGLSVATREPLSSLPPEVDSDVAVLRVEAPESAVPESAVPESAEMDRPDSVPDATPDETSVPELTEITPEVPVTAPPQAVVATAPEAPEPLVAEGNPPDLEVASDAIPADSGSVTPEKPLAEDAPSLVDDPSQPLVMAAVTGVTDPGAESAPATPGALTADAAPEAVPAPELSEAETDALPELAPDLAPELAPEEAALADAAATEANGKPSRLGMMAGSLLDRAKGSSARLPTIGGDAAEAGETPADAPVATLGPDSPLVRFAATQSAPEGVPRMAVILIDDGTAPMGPAELETLPFPVSFAIAPSHPQAGAVAEGYRERGFEVLALADLPDGAQPSDVEVTLAGLMDTVPGAVGVLEGQAGGLQGSRDVAAQAAAWLGASGHGLVMEPKGLNTAQKLATKAGVPAVTLFRDFDGEGQDESLIRRTLDQSAFKAKQDGAVVMLGRLRAGTLSSLMLWGLQDRGDNIALVPVSVVLKESMQVPTE